MDRDERLFMLALKRVEEKRSFYMHFAAFLLVNGVFWFYYAWQDWGGFPWPAFITFFWGIGLAAHFLEAFFSVDEYGSAVEREYQRMLDRRDRR